MRPWLIKVGGAALSNPEAIKEVAAAVTRLRAEGIPVVLVHGGGPMINEKLNKLGITWEFFEGQRITSEPMISGIIEALGEVNQLICQAIDVMGLKCSAIHANVHKMFMCRQMKPELGLVGEILNVKNDPIQECLKNGITPVISPIGMDEKGQCYNINADWGASKLAISLNARVLLYCTDQRGILDLNGLPYDSLTLDQLRFLMDKQGVTGGMLAKAKTIEYALENGIERVCVIHALELSDLVDSKIGGTLCTGLSRLNYSLKMTGENNVAI